MADAPPIAPPSTIAPSAGLAPGSLLPAAASQPDWVLHPGRAAALCVHPAGRGALGARSRGGRQLLRRGAVFSRRRGSRLQPCSLPWQPPPPYPLCTALPPPQVHEKLKTAADHERYLSAAIPSLPEDAVKASLHGVHLGFGGGVVWDHPRGRAAEGAEAPAEALTRETRLNCGALAHFRQTLTSSEVNQSISTPGLLCWWAQMGHHVTVCFSLKTESI